MRLLLAAAFASVAVSPAAAMPLHQFSDLAISPAGDRVAAVESDEQPNSSTRPPEHVVVRDARTGIVVQTIPGCAGCRYSGLSFAPDGRLLADRQRQGHDAPALSAGNDPGRASKASPRTRASRPTAKASQCWRPSMPARKPARPRPASARSARSAKRTTNSASPSCRSAAGRCGRSRPPTATSTNMTGCPTAAASSSTSAPGNGDNNWWVATLDRIDLASGAVTRIAAPKMQLNFPRVSPDGRTVAFIGGLMSDFGAVGGDIYTVPVAGGTPTDIDPWLSTAPSPRCCGTGTAWRPRR